MPETLVRYSSIDHEIVFRQMEKRGNCYPSFVFQKAAAIARWEKKKRLELRLSLCTIFLSSATAPFLFHARNHRKPRCSHVNAHKFSLLSPLSSPLTLASCFFFPCRRRDFNSSVLLIKSYGPVVLRWVKASRFARERLWKWILTRWKWKTELILLDSRASPGEIKISSRPTTENSEKLFKQGSAFYRSGRLQHPEWSFKYFHLWRLRSNPSTLSDSRINDEKYRIIFEYIFAFSITEKIRYGNELFVV